jgi:hypothetical protein
MSGEDIPVRCGKIAVAVLRGEGADAKVLFGAAVRGHTGGSVVPGYRPHRLIFAIFFYDPGANSVEALPMFPAMAATDSEVRLNSENTEFCRVELHYATDKVPFVGRRLALREIGRNFMCPFGDDA